MAVNARTVILGARDLNLTAAREMLHSTATTNKIDSDTINLISSLVLAESKLVGTSTIILASFNILAAFITAVSILYDGYKASMKYDARLKSPKLCISSIHPAETCPLILSFGVIIQGLIFAGVQGRGLELLYVDGCSTVAQILWPAIFIVPYIQLVFGLECVLRSFRSLPFQARGKYDVTICCFAVILLLIATWVPSNVYPEEDVCFGSLLWNISSFGKLGFAILSSTAGLMVICVVIIFCRLSSVNLIDPHQRIVASRIVHYMMVGIVSLALILPFFFSLFNDGGNMKLTMMATVILNLTGLTSGFLHLVLRSNTSTTSFGPKIGRSWDGRKHDIRIFGPNELALYNPLFDTVRGPATLSSEDPGHGKQLFQQRDSRMKTDMDLEKYSSSPTLPKSDGFEVDLTQITEKTYYARKPSLVSYSLFPSQESHQYQEDHQSVSIYNIADLDLPRPAFARNSRHKRNSSDSSTTTVQIGLRLSHALFDSRTNDEEFCLPATTYGTRSAHAPMSPMSPLSPQPLRPTIFSGFQRAVISPIVTATSTLKSNITNNGHLSPLPDNSSVPPSSPNSSFTPKGNSNIPPKRESADPNLSSRKFSTPRATTFMERIRASSIKLSPTVYKPEKNHSTPVESSPQNTPLPVNPKKSSVRRNSQSDTNSQASNTDSDWI